jgi:hypothetical protein
MSPAFGVSAYSRGWCSVIPSTWFTCL